MAFCAGCGTERREGDRFCPSCGRSYDALVQQNGTGVERNAPELGAHHDAPRPPIVVFPVGSPLEAVVGWLVVGLGIGLVGVGALAAASASTYLQYQSPASLTADWRGRILVALYGALVDPTFAQRADAMVRLRTLGWAGVAIGVVLVLAGMLAVARSRPGRARWAGPLVALGCAGVVLVGGTVAGASSVVALPPTPAPGAAPTPHSGASVPVAVAPTPFGAPTPTAPGFVLPLPSNPFAAPASPTPSPTPTPVVLDALVELGARFRGEAVRRTVDMDLQPGMQVTGQAVLTRGQDVDFQVLDPRGTPVVPLKRQGATWSFSFTASTGGQYRLLFDNSFSTISTKTVSVRYTISR